MTDETNPTPGPPTTPASPQPPAAAVPPAAAMPPAAAVPPAPGAVPPSASVPPAPPAGYGQAAPSGYELPSPAKKKSPLLRVGRIVASVVVVLLIGVGWKAFQDHNATASAPEKGACVHATGTNTTNPKVTKVDCSDTAADYIVLAKISGGSSTSCDTVDGTEAAFSSTRGSKTLYVLCLKHK
jgi:hypothetical protein